MRDGRIYNSIKLYKLVVYIVGVSCLFNMMALLIELKIALAYSMPLFYYLLYKLFCVLMSDKVKIMRYGSSLHVLYRNGNKVVIKNDNYVKLKHCIIFNDKLITLKCDPITNTILNL